MKTDPQLSPQKPRCALTRLELLALVTALGLLACVALPALGGASGHSEEAICLNNLRRIGRAYAEWGTGRLNQSPWWISQAEGGTYPNSGEMVIARNVWFQFAWISNELGSPRILACPADPKRRPARDFSSAPDGGFLNPAQRNNAVSYLLQLNTHEARPNTVVAADRDVKVDGIAGTGSGFRNIAVVSFAPTSHAGWTNELHGNSGNMLYYDGSVEQVPQSRFVQRMSFRADTGPAQLLIP